MPPPKLAAADLPETLLVAIFYTICACRALMVGKQGFEQRNILRVYGEFLQGVHGSCRLS